MRSGIRGELRYLGHLFLACGKPVENLCWVALGPLMLYDSEVHQGQAIIACRTHDLN
jgi:hypothetical protein